MERKGEGEKEAALGKEKLVSDAVSTKASVQPGGTTVLGRPFKIVLRGGQGVCIPLELAAGCSHEGDTTLGESLISTKPSCQLISPNK